MINGNYLHAALKSLTAEANISAQFERAHVRVTVQWTDNDTIGASYGVNVTPNVGMITMGETIVQMIVPYNKRHNLSIAASLCGHNSATSIYDLSYGKLDP